MSFFSWGQGKAPDGKHGKGRTPVAVNVEAIASQGSLQMLELNEADESGYDMISYLRDPEESGDLQPPHAGSPANELVLLPKETSATPNPAELDEEVPSDEAGTKGFFPEVNVNLYTNENHRWQIADNAGAYEYTGPAWDMPNSTEDQAQEEPRAVEVAHLEELVHIATASHPNISDIQVNSWTTSNYGVHIGRNEGFVGEYSGSSDPDVNTSRDALQGSRQKPRGTQGKPVFRINHFGGGKNMGLEIGKNSGDVKVRRV